MIALSAMIGNNPIRPRYRDNRGNYLFGDQTPSGWSFITMVSCLFRNWLRLVLAVAVLVCAGSFSASADQFTEKIDDIFAAYDQPGSPGCAVAVLHRGELVYERAHGCAQLEWDAPITPATIFHVASVSKQFTALAVVLLAEEGKLSLDDDVRKHVPELPDYGPIVTIRHLLQHTSGLPDVWELGGLAGWRPGDLVTELDVLALAVRQKALDFPPGEQFEYGNTGYTLAALIVRRVSGQSLRDYAETRVFKPLGMKNTHFRDNHRTVVKNRASAYVQLGDRFEVAEPAFEAIGSTGLLSTVEDLAVWDRNFYERRVGQSALDRLLTPAILNSGAEARFGTGLGYGMGLVVGDYRGLKTVSHSGSDAGFRAEYLQFPEQQFSVIVLSNLHELYPYYLARAVADVCLAKDFPAAQQPSANPPPSENLQPKLSAEQLAVWAGIYWNLRTGDSWVISADESVLRLGRLGRTGGRELTPLAEDRFQIGGFPVELVFTASTEQSPQRLTWVDVESVDFVALPKLSLTHDELNQYTGNYFSEQLNARYVVQLRENELIVQGWRDEYGPLHPVDADGFSLRPPLLPSCFVRFSRSANNGVNGFTLSTERCREIGFVKRED